MTETKPIGELVAQYKECMEQVAKQIPNDILGKDTPLTSEDYRTITTTIFMENQKQIRDANKPEKPFKPYNKPYTPYEKPHYEYKSEGNGNGNGGYEGPSSEAQQSFIAKLIASIGTKAEDIVDKFLDANGVESIDKLNKSQASSLITTLKPLAPKRENRRK